MNIPSPRSHRKARIEIIPLIDIMFFLLATFVMVSTSMIKNQGIDVNLPVAATGTPQPRETDYTTITVLQSGQIAFEKEDINLEELPARLQALKNAQEEPKVFLNGDEGAAFGRAIAVLDEARKIGITKISIETRPR